MKITILCGLTLEQLDAVQMDRCSIIRTSGRRFRAIPLAESESLIHHGPKLNYFLLANDTEDMAHAAVLQTLDTEERVFKLQVELWM